jgi:IS5 family transposase
MATLPERLDWLWFLGLDLEDDIPNHSVLSKARKRWGTDTFRRVFERIVRQCVEEGMVEGSKIFVDSSLVDADASKESVVDTKDLRSQLSKQYRQLEKRLEEQPSARKIGPDTKANKRFASSTDPDAAIVQRGNSRLRYQTHRVTDGSGVITATEMTPGDVNEGNLLMDLVEQHEATTGSEVKTAVADSKYGIKENYLACHDAGIAAHIPEMKEGTDKRYKKRGLFMMDRFEYDSGRDTYLCPAGEELKPRTLHKNRNQIEYKAPKKTCAACQLRDLCTKSKSGRTVMRHIRQKDLDKMCKDASSRKSRKDLRVRQHLIEGSFGNSTRYGYKRARWRRLWRVSIQDYLICTVQNIQKLVRHGGKPVVTPAMALRGAQMAENALLEGLIVISELIWARTVGFLCSNVKRNHFEVSLNLPV